MMKTANDFAKRITLSPSGSCRRFVPM